MGFYYFDWYLPYLISLMFINSFANLIQLSASLIEGVEASVWTTHGTSSFLQWTRDQTHHSLSSVCSLTFSWVDLIPVSLVMSLLAPWDADPHISPSILSPSRVYPLCGSQTQRLYFRLNLMVLLIRCYPRTFSLKSWLFVCYRIDARIADRYLIWSGERSYE